MLDDAGPSSGAAASAPPASDAPARGEPSTTTATSTSATGAPTTGFWSYVIVGANAYVGRDANVPPLAHFVGGGCHEESL
jgi:hypothetical protein